MVNGTCSHIFQTIQGSLTKVPVTFEECEVINLFLIFDAHGFNIHTHKGLTCMERKDAC